MKLIYVGNHDFASFALAKEAKQREGTYWQHEVSPGETLQELEQELISQAGDLYCYDLTSLPDSEELLVSTIERIRQAVNAEVILYAPGYSPESRVLVSLRALGIGAVLFEDENLGALQKELHRFVEHPESQVSWEEQETLLQQRSQFYEQLRQEHPCLHEDEPEETAPGACDPLPSAKREQEKTRFIRKPEKVLRIAVAGSQRRIGTTTAALQLVKFLNLQQEDSAIYLEYNGTGYVDACRNQYQVQEEPELSGIRFRNVRLYENPQKLSELLSCGYSYIIYDYGSLKEGADRSSIFEKDRLLLVGGGKLGELAPMTDAIRDVLDQKQVFYLFNYLHDCTKEQEDVRKLMRGSDAHTFFLSSAPDPFTYNPDHSPIFERILREEPKQVVKESRQHQLFPWLKRRNHHAAI